MQVLGAASLRARRDEPARPGNLSSQRSDARPGRRTVHIPGLAPLAHAKQHGMARFGRKRSHRVSPIPSGDQQGRPRPLRDQARTALPVLPEVRTATQAAAEEMQKRKSGHICNVVGILGKHSMAMAAAYSASKFGVVGFSKSMAEELKRFGVKFTLFYFGGVDSPFWDNIALKVERKKMLSCQTAAKAILYALSAEPQAIPMEINIQPDSHLFF